MDAVNLQSLRRKLLTVAYESGEPCHLASSLGALDAIWGLYYYIMKPEDIFINSVGHTALAQYVVLNAKGIISDELLATFGKPGSTLYGHPAINVDGCYVGSGSLGHGVAVSVGSAYAKRLKGESGRVFCLSSDGESEEGSFWEAAQLASRFGLDNLFWGIVANKTAPNCLEKTAADQFENLYNRLSAFGWCGATLRISRDRKTPEDITGDESGRPVVWGNVAPKGNGITAMEADPQAWHRRKLTESEYREFMEQA